MTIYRKVNMFKYEYSLYGYIIRGTYHITHREADAPYVNPSHANTKLRFPQDIEQNQQSTLTSSAHSHRNLTDLATPAEAYPTTGAKYTHQQLGFEK